MRDPLVRHCAGLRERCTALGIPVLYTAQPGGMTDEERGLLKDFWGPGMRLAPEDRTIVEELTPGPTDQVLTKWRYSAFARSDLLDRLRTSGRYDRAAIGVHVQAWRLLLAPDQPLETSKVVVDGLLKVSARYAA